MPKTITLIVIFRNEAAGIRSIFPQIDRTCFDHIIGIDGNSSDESVSIVESMGIPVYTQKKKGLGAAMLEGREKVNTDAFIFYHPDGNEDPSDLPQMAALLREGKDFVVASRMIKGAVNEEDIKFLKWRKWANNGFALIANILFGKKGNRTTDVTNGFRGISVKAFDAMELDVTDLTMDYLMVIRALKKNIIIHEMPTKEGQRIGGDSNFPSLSTGVAELKLLWREFLGR